MATTTEMDRLGRWRSRLCDAPQTVLPTDYVRPSPHRVVGAQTTIGLRPETRSAMKALAGTLRQADSPTACFMAVLAALVVLVYRLTDDEDICLGTSNAYSSPFVLRTRVDARLTFRELIRQIEEQYDTDGNDPISLAELLEALHPGSSQSSRPALFSLRVFAQEHCPSKQLVQATDQHTELELVFALSNRTDDPYVLVYYNQLLFSAERISILCSQVETILCNASANVDIPLGTISLLDLEQRSRLPKPDSHLHWGCFRGLIHEIFARNAKMFPERVCAFETADPLQPNDRDRIFTYRHIHESSNVLAHFLIGNGIHRGDFVMIYASRNADLIVAMMGVLKAGAAISIIDPSYPPERQKIYLKVAAPKALLMLRKAGRLDPSVREYIHSQLNLVTAIPVIYLTDQGELSCVTSDGLDCLERYYQYKETDTGIVVGPDSTPTLSFTSGSEGTPKGVEGRHFSLTYYFPWMAQTFGLSENDRFTMLSGIAHDPIQRDIFTPLFLGAQVRIPTASDIGTPGRLAEWMAENEVTVTHLTPAMGQLLSTQATSSIPTLRNAFFVGDLLTKRECLRLQGLANNVRIINMYGTTETQRAVSYYAVPAYATEPAFLESEKDIIPAGQGMLDVQLIIVNRHDRLQTCAIGEIGEIYVRAAGLAEGYSNSPQLTNEKFIKNWYVDENRWITTEEEVAATKHPWSRHYYGARDRLYRSGDLGRYLLNGDVECAGRADNQVKIRGFRVELGEIDACLSQHPSVRENVTLVRRDKDEEQVLISYIVPLENLEFDKLTGLKNGKTKDCYDANVNNIIRCRKLISHIREHLKQKLPTYAVPTLIVPLTKLPLNPNGKIDKPALPFPDTALLRQTWDGSKSKTLQTAVQMTQMQKAVTDLWHDVIPHTSTSLGLDDNFFDVGGHSILATRLIFAIRQKFAVPAPLMLIFREPTIRGLAKEIEKLQIDGLMSSSLTQISAPLNNMCNYAEDAAALVADLPDTFPMFQSIMDLKSVTILVTGTTGFLGTYILQNLMSRSTPNLRVIAHVRAQSKLAGLERLRRNAEAYGVWNESWVDKLEVILGDLTAPKLGVAEPDYRMLINDVDAIIHNGAMVHWVYPYVKLRDANVKSTVEAIRLCAEGKPKVFTFISSTSTMDVEHYVQLSDRVLEAGGLGIPESDDLQGAAQGLVTGYGQSKWSAEYLVRRAGERGLRSCIIRPGYILGNSQTGVMNTDDFLARLIKGCAQIGKTPEVVNTLNMVPVDYVARIAVSSVFHNFIKTPTTLIAQIDSKPRMRMDDMLNCLSKYGFGTEMIEYVPWRVTLEKYVIKGTKTNALYPLLHFVLDNLPQNTRAPVLDDTNTQILIKLDSTGVGGNCERQIVNEDQMGIYLAFLVGIGFLDRPTAQVMNPLPAIEIKPGILNNLQSVGGRGAKA